MTETLPPNNRHGVLLRDGANWRVLHNDFGPALRVKAAGSGDTNNVEIAFNYFDRTNENGISLLTGGSTSVTNKVQVHHNILSGVIDSGNQITIGDDGGGAHPDDCVYERQHDDPEQREHQAQRGGQFRRDGG